MFLISFIYFWISKIVLFLIYIYMFSEYFISFVILYSAGILLCDIGGFSRVFLFVSLQ